VLRKQPERGWLWFKDGSCIRLRPAYWSCVWSYDFMKDATTDSRSVRLLIIFDDYSWECPVIDVERRLTSGNVLDRLAQLSPDRRVSAYLRSGNGPGLIANAVRE
jgi:putative transposase